MKVGDYVRTKWGYICEIVNINDFREPSMKYGVEASYLKDIMFVGDEDIIKSSQNIIDLIEIGDYVNGFKVDEIDEKGIYNYNSYDGWRVNIASCNEDIESIVTKEQFSQKEYRIGE